MQRASNNRLESDGQSLPRPTISICITACDRPALLRRCLESVFAGEEQPDQVVIGDDSQDPRETEEACAAFPHVLHVIGPRRGCCANRNRALRRCHGSLIALIDDDVVLPPEFVARAREIARSDSGRTVYSGDVLEDGEIVSPGNPTFLGHPGPTSNGRLEVVTMNSILFSRAVISEAPFDEWIWYGFEEVEWGARLLALGFRIEYRSDLVTWHEPPPSRATDRLRRRRARRARLYATFKRYLIWQNRPFKALAFALSAPLHQAAHHARRGEFHEFPSLAADTWAAFTEVTRQRARVGRRAQRDAA